MEYSMEKFTPSEYFNQDHRTVTSYGEAAHLWAKVRSPEKGKPVANWLRMYKVGEDFEFRITGYGERALGRLSPDNTFEFILSNEMLMQQAQTVVSAIHKWLPFAVMRHRKGLYRVAHTKVVASAINDRDYKPDTGYYRNHQWGRYYAHYTPVMREQNMYYQGIKYNILTGECLNPRAEEKLVENPDQRKVWRNALSKFKRGIKARARVHALEGIIDQVWAEREGQNRWHWRQPDWSSPQWMNLLEDSIRDNTFSQELLQGFVQSSGDGYYVQQKPTSSDVVKAVDKVCNEHSVELRRRFNVFEGDADDSNSVGR
jgi:hypothetical protein